VCDYIGFLRSDERAVKDVRDFLEINRGKRENGEDIISPLAIFSFYKLKKRKLNEGPGQ
jgi:hypothetical protein